MAFNQYGHQQNPNIEPKKRRDGSQASKAKSNKTIDYQHTFQNIYQPVNRIFSSIFPELSLPNVAPPLQQYERLALQIPPTLTKFINRRKCESKNQHQSTEKYVDVTFARFNPDGRFCLVGSAIGVAYVYNSYDFSFHYQYNLQNKQAHSLTGACFHTSNTNRFYISNHKGQLHLYENVLHFEPGYNEYSTRVSNSPLATVHCSPCGSELLTCDQQGNLIMIEEQALVQDTDQRKLKDAKDQNLSKSAETIRVFQERCTDCCYHGFSRQLVFAAGPGIALLDRRVPKDRQIVLRQDYVDGGRPEISSIALNNGGSLIAAAGPDGARVFDIRNIGSSTYKCLYTAKPSTDYFDGTVCKFHPLCTSTLIVGDKDGSINFYDLNYTTSPLALDTLFTDQEANNSDNNPIGQLYSIGYIRNAHRQSSGKGTAIIDFDVHPTGNSLATVAADKDVRFWTCPGAGSVQRDIFHDGQVDPVDQEYQFNQSHKEQQEQRKLIELIQDDIGRMATLEGEDIFTREIVQTKIRRYINIADDRLRSVQEEGTYDIK